MSTPKISVIVPVYKVEQYLHRCIDSILAQTFTDFELLLINDGSPDNCGAICDEYAIKDARVRVFHKKNGGVSSARNLGLDNAKGEWVAFIDSDDYIDSNYLSSFNPLIKYGIVLQGYKKQEKNKTSIAYLKEETKSTDQLLIDILKFEDEENILFRPPWSKLFSTEILTKEKLRFDESLCIAEDYIFFLNYLYYIKDGRYSSNSGYNYCVDNSSLTKQKYSIDTRVYISQKIQLIGNLLRIKYNSNKFYGGLMSVQIMNLLRNSYRVKTSQEERLKALNYCKEILKDKEYISIPFPYSFAKLVSIINIKVVDLIMYNLFLIINRLK